MIWLLASLAWTGPPANVDIDDPDPWEARARAALKGPSKTCWRLTGATAATIELHQPPRVFSRARSTTYTRTGTFVGILDKGIWTSFEVTLRENGQPSDEEPMVRPLLGTVAKGAVRNPNRQADPQASESDTDDRTSVSIGLDGDVDVESSSGQATRLLLDLVDGAWSDLPSTSFVQWNDAGAAAELVIEAPLQTDKPNDLVRTEVRFPGGQPVPNAVDTILPKRVSVGSGLLRARLLSAQLHLRGVPVDGEFLPSLETLSGIVGVLGVTVGYDQRIVYHQATPCDQMGPSAPPSP